MAMCPSLEPEQHLKQAQLLAHECGFDALGVTRFPLLERNAQRLRALDTPGRVGTMAWLQKTAYLRAHPEVRWPECKSVLCLAINYQIKQNPLEELKNPSKPIIAAYAHYEDYHRILIKRLKRYTRRLKEEIGGEYRAFVDTAPIAEKPLAQRAGLGWQGKHTNLVSRTFGSWFLLAVILSDKEFPHASTAKNLCGSCRRCQDICPTDALQEAYRLKIPSCLAYLSIEHNGPIPLRWRKAMANRLFGCDDCIAVCPWNKFAKSSSTLSAFAKSEFRHLSLQTILQMDDNLFVKTFRHTPLYRLTLARLRRNALIVAGNTQDPFFVPLVKPFLNNRDPVIREASAWALQRLTTSLPLKPVTEHE